METTFSPEVRAAAALREIADLPGPRGWPIVGNAFQVERSQLHRNVEAWGREFGPLFRFRLGRRTLLVLSDHEALMVALRDRPEGFRRTRHLETIGLEMGLTPGVFAATGEAWKRQRRMVMAGFDPTHVRAYFPSLLKVAQRLRGRWRRAASADEGIELQPELMRFTVDAIAGLAFGADVNTLESDEEVIQQHLDKIFPMVFKRVFSIVPWWRWFPRAADRQLERSVVAVNEAIAGFIAAARARLAADPARRAQPPNLLEAMIVAADAGGGMQDGGDISDREVAGNVLTMLLAGEDTTANTLAWMIYLLHRHPQALQRAQHEVRALALDSSAFTPETLAGLDYLEACAHETMRLKPVAPFQVIEALRDTVIQGVRVPQGTAVWCLMRGDSVSERHFTDPQAFRPERWLAGAGPAQAASASAAKRVSMPFGAGPRVCPGRYLALLEIKMAMAMLLTHFDIAAVDTPDGAEAAEHMAFTMMPVGLRMRLRPCG
jgi:cytochrome P450